MPIRVEIFHTLRFVRIVATGAVTRRELEDHFDKLVVENALPYAKLFDATDVVPVYDDHDALMMGARLSAYTANFGSGPLAVVGQSEAVHATFRRFVNLSPSKRPAGIFPTETEALTWLEKQTGTVLRNDANGTSAPRP